MSIESVSYAVMIGAVIDESITIDNIENYLINDVIPVNALR